MVSAVPLEAIKANVLDCQFAPGSPGAGWTACNMYPPTTKDWLHRAVMIDQHSRRGVGWSTRPSLAEELAIVALSNAIDAQRPRVGLVHLTQVVAASTPFISVCRCTVCWDCDLYEAKQILSRERSDRELLWDAKD